MNRIASLAAAAFLTACLAPAAPLLAQSRRPASAPVPAVTPAAPAPRAWLVPARTPIRLQLETHLNTRDASYGDGFAARVVTAVFYQGHEVIPSGSIIEGHVLRVRDARPAVSDSELLLRPDLLTTPGGQRYTISAHLIQGDPHSRARVDSEGLMREPRGLMKTDLHHAEIGAGAGAVGGALLAGSQGALIGTGLGAAVAAGIWLVRHRHLELNPGSLLTVRLDRPLEIAPQ